jgi:hypothetical protein
LGPRIDADQIVHDPTDKRRTLAKKTHREGETLRRNFVDTRRREEIVIAEIFSHAEFNFYVYFRNNPPNSRIRPDGTMQPMRMHREKRARSGGTFRRQHDCGAARMPAANDG